MLRYLIVRKLPHRRRLLLLFDNYLAGLAWKIVHMRCLLDIKLLRLDHFRAKIGLLIEWVWCVKASWRYLAHIRGALTTLLLGLLFLLINFNRNAVLGTSYLVCFILRVFWLCQGLLILLLALTRFKIGVDLYRFFLWNILNCLVFIWNRLFHVVELFAVRRKLHFNVARIRLTNLHDSFTMNSSGVHNLLRILLFHELITVAIQDLLIIRLVLCHFTFVAEFPITSFLLLVYVIIFSLPVVYWQCAQTMNCLSFANELWIHILNILVFIRKNVTFFCVVDLFKEQAVIWLNDLVWFPIDISAVDPKRLPACILGLFEKVEGALLSLRYVKDIVFSKFNTILTLFFAVKVQILLLNNFLLVTLILVLGFLLHWQLLIRGSQVFGLLKQVLDPLFLISFGVYATVAALVWVILFRPIYDLFQRFLLLASHDARLLNYWRLRVKLSINLLLYLLSWIGVLFLVHRRNGSSTSAYLVKIYRLVDSLIIVVHVLLVNFTMEQVVVGILTTIFFYFVFTKSYLALKFILLVCYARIFKVLLVIRIWS